jgi:hypothetical protein
MADPEKQLVARIAGAASFAIPLALNVLAASPEPYWLDSPEFTAAAQTLGIPHPPGHPLYVMLAKPFTLLPIGGVAFRVSLASAMFGAIASFLLYKLAFAVIGTAAPDLRQWHRAVIACTTALIASVTPGWWIQCVRAEVYSLQIMVLLGALYALVLYCLPSTRPRRRLLYAAVFIIGIGMTNHHFVMLALVPAVIPPLIARMLRQGTRKTIIFVSGLAGVGACGLLPYLFLPIRSAAGSAIALGGVHTFGDFFWVVSAKIYQKSMTREHGDALFTRALEAMYTMMGGIGPVAGPIIVIASLAGLYLLIRQPSTRMTGLVLAVLIATTVLLRSIMGFDPYNPDYYGYMLPAVAGLSLGFAALCAILIDAVRQYLPGGVWIAGILVAGLVALPINRARAAGPEVDLSDFRATRLMYDLSLGKARPGTRVLTANYKLFFVLWSARFIDGSRPDIKVINPRFFGYPGYLTSALAADPEIKELARSMVIHGQITEAATADLAWKGPLRIEPDLWLPNEVLDYLLPDSPVYTASTQPVTTADVLTVSPGYLARWRRFYDLLGPDWQEHETWRMLCWYHYQDALFLARRGDRANALKAAEMSLALGNKAPEITGLKKALEQPGKGPLDVTPFLPFKTDKKK